MRKPPKDNSIRERAADFFRRFALTHQEQILAGAILLSLLVGSLVMHYRRTHPVAHPAAASPAPRRGGVSGE